MLKRLLLLLVMAFSLLTLLLACNSVEGTEKGVEPVNLQLQKDLTEPTTLTLYNSAGGTLENYQSRIEAPLKKKFPNVTLNYIQRGDGSQPENLIAAGTLPDFSLVNFNSLPSLIDAKLVEDLDPWIKKYEIDLSRYQDGVIESMRKYSSNNTLLGLPYNTNTQVMFYNKDLFDKFGVPYPTDHMTWDQVYDFAKRMTRIDGSEQYKGIEMQYNLLIQNSPLSTNYVDPKTNKATINTEGWKRLLNNIRRFYEIPGNTKIAANGLNDFIKERNIAIYLGNTAFDNFRNVPGLNWDVVSYPIFPDLPTVGLQLHAPSMTLSPSSNHKDLVLKIMEYVLSDEWQSYSGSLGGGLPVVKSTKVQELYGTLEPGFKGKHLAAAFMLKVAPSRDISPYDDIVGSVIVDKLKEMISTGQDTNTALREAEDSANQMIVERTVQ